MKKMIAVAEAKAIVRQLQFQSSTLSTALHQALGYCLAADVLSPIDMPPFRQSAMDGYALCLHDSNQYQLIDEIQAGDAKQPVLKAGQAVRIFTGAAVPDTANAVIMQEKTSLSAQLLNIDARVAEDSNIRPQGEQITVGTVAMQKGQLLHPAAIGFLAGLGIQQVEVYKKPKIAIVATGNELVQAGQPLQHGQIYESNLQMLRTALQQQGYHELSTHHIKDDYAQTKAVFDRLMRQHDFLIVSGGISVGAYDFVGKALMELGTETLFYKVRQKPGKPMYLGIKDNCTIFALPGNPAASLSCFYQYVLTALKGFEGVADFSLPLVQLPLKDSYHKKGNRAHFLKAHADAEGVRILGKQSSAMLQSFVQSNAMVFIPEDQMLTEAGRLVQVYIMDNI